MSDAVNLKSLITEIKESVKQQSSSQRDEVRVMQAMLNDKEYVVDVYASKGVVSQYSPFADARSIVTSVLTNTVGLSKTESADLAQDFQFTKSDASSMINLGSQFIHSYLETGRKLPLGGRAESNVSLLPKEVAQRTVSVPNNREVETVVPAHKSIKVKGSCPEWLK